MLTNYLTTFLRILMRQKIYSAINVAGLSIGLAAALIIGLYVADELSYDRFHSDADRIYRFTFDGVNNGQDINSILVGYPIAETLQQEIASVESTVRLKPFRDYRIQYEDKVIATDQFLYADSTFFQFFNFRLISGNAQDVLRGPGKVVLTQSMANQLFGYDGRDDSGVIGKLIEIGEPKMTAMVVGIAADPPSNSHFHFEIIGSLDSWEPSKHGTWTSIGACATYFKLQPKFEINSIESQVSRFVDTYWARDWEKWMKIPWKQTLANASEGSRVTFLCQPLTDIRLHSQYHNELEPNGSIVYVYSFGGIGILILLLACVNFTNLSTAKATTRAKEIGIRKTVGAIRQKLITQFLLESFSYTLLSVIIAIAIVSVFILPFNILAGKHLSIAVLYQPYFLIGIAVLIILVSVIAGGHPAFFLTSFKPAAVLKGKLQSQLKGRGLRESLVVFQFCVSIGMIICTLLVYKQVQFLQSQDLGFNKENILRLNNTEVLSEKGEAFKEELLRSLTVKAASFANNTPPYIKDAFGYKAPGVMPEEHLASMHETEFDNLSALGLQMVKGRYFSREVPSDSGAVVINEATAADLGFDDVEGKYLVVWGDTLQVIGIVKDFHLQGLQAPVRPLLIYLSDATEKHMAIRLNKGNVKDQVLYVEGLWKKFLPGEPFEWSFIDQEFEAQYRAEEKVGQVFLLFTGLAIIIACLGLFGLAAFTTVQRTKEIGIRKVMGASVQQVVVLLSKDFVKLILIAFLIAVPISWYGMNQWLTTFAYRIDFNFMVALIAGAGVLTIALVTVSYQSIKAAMGNPVESLRSE